MYKCAHAIVYKCAHAIVYKCARAIVYNCACAIVYKCAREIACASAHASGLCIVTSVLIDVLIILFDNNISPLLVFL